jgi:nucleotidyltransferase/DNA polymerase involved in DNA repair
MHVSEVRHTFKSVYFVFLPEKRQQGLTSWLESASELQDPAQLRLAVAGVIVEEMRAAVFQQTGFHCSAGISHNKVFSDYTESCNIFYTANLKSLCL